LGEGEQGLFSVEGHGEVVEGVGWRVVERYGTGGVQGHFESPGIIRLHSLHNLITHLHLHPPLRIIHIPRRDRRIHLQLPKHIHLHLQLLQILNPNLHHSLLRQIPNLNIDDVLRAVIDLTVGHLLSLGQGLFVLLPGLLLLLDAADEQSVVEFGGEGVEAGFWVDWEGVLDLEGLVQRVEVELGQADLGEAVEDGD
jgi:hypothetical protein